MDPAPWKKALRPLKNAANRVWDIAGGVGGGISDIAGDVGDSISDIAGGVGSDICDTGGGVGGGICNIVGHTRDCRFGCVDGIINAVRKSLAASSTGLGLYDFFVLHNSVEEDSHSRGWQWD